MDKFIKEKLDIWNEPEGIDIAVPDSSACKNKIRVQLETRQVKKKRKMILGFSIGGLATVATILIIVFTVILAPSLVYTDKDLIAYHVSVDELRNDYGVLAISDAYYGFDLKESYIYKHENTGVAVYSKLVYKNSGVILEFRVIFVDNYEVSDNSSFYNLKNAYNDNRFTGNYELKNDILYAKLIYESQQYFLQVSMGISPSHVIEEDNNIGSILETILTLLQ